MKEAHAKRFICPWGGRRCRGKRCMAWSVEEINDEQGSCSLITKP